MQRWATSLGAHLALELRHDGERPLTDARHARIQNWLVELLRHGGWVVEAEVSFNHYGDRGRIDILADHPVRRVLLVVEIKTRIDDIQDLLGRLDVKRRVAPMLAQQSDWKPDRVVPALILQEGTTARRQIRSHPALFAWFVLRGRSAMGWLRSPTAAVPRGILLVVSPRQ